MARQTQGEKIEAINVRIGIMAEQVETIFTALTGDIKEGKPGLLVRTDRLEQQWGAVRWFLMAIVLALIPLAVNSCQQRLETNQERQVIAEVVQQEQAERTPTPTPTRTPPLDTSTPSPSLTPEVTPILASAVEIKALSGLCWVETRGMGLKKPTACASVLSTVFTRAYKKLLSDGTILGTIRWECREDSVTCQFPAFVSFGCEGITHPCPFDDPKGMVEFMGYVYQYLYGKLTGECSGYAYYNVDDLSEEGAGCVITNDKQVMYFWNEGENGDDR